MSKPVIAIIGLAAAGFGAYTMLNTTTPKNEVIVNPDVNSAFVFIKPHANTGKIQYIHTYF